VWTGAGNFALAVANDELLIDLETAVLAGEDAYDGLTAFLLAETVDGERVFEAVVVGTTPAPAPDAVPATALEDIAAG
jgi:hypothetical protein